MKFWFINNLFVEKEGDSDIIAELYNEFSKNNILTSAGGYQTADLIECILKASGLVDSDFVEYITDDLRETRRELIKAEGKINEIRSSVKFDELNLQDLREIDSVIKGELEFLKYIKVKFVRADIREHLSRMEIIRDKLETILNRG